MPVVFGQPDPHTTPPELTDETRALIQQDQQGSALLSALQAQTREDKIRLQTRYAQPGPSGPGYSGPAKSGSILKKSRTLGASRMS